MDWNLVIGILGTPTVGVIGKALLDVAGRSWGSVDDKQATRARRALKVKAETDALAADLTNEGFAEEAREIERSGRRRAVWLVAQEKYNRERPFLFGFLYPFCIMGILTGLMGVLIVLAPVFFAGADSDAAAGVAQLFMLFMVFFFIPIIVLERRRDVAVQLEVENHELVGLESDEEGSQ